MRLLILQAHGEHADNETFREALCMCRAMKRLPAGHGVEAQVCGPGYYNFPQRHELIKWADVILCLENYERNGWVPDLSSAAAYTVFWTIDSHVRFGPHLAFAQKHKFDLVLSSTAEIVPQWKREGFTTVWFPNAYPSDLIDRRPDVPKCWPVGFCGLFPGNRRAFYEQVSAIVPIHLDTFVIGEAMVQAVCSYEMHLNRNVRNDVNYRTFETLGCGTFLLTNKTDRLGDLFDVGIHLGVYDGTAEGAVKAIGYYASRPALRDKMARRGYMHVRQHHTYDVRARQFLDIVGGRA